MHVSRNLSNSTIGYETARMDTASLPRSLRTIHPQTTNQKLADPLPLGFLVGNLASQLDNQAVHARIQVLLSFQIDKRIASHTDFFNRIDPMAWDCGP